MTPAPYSEDTLVQQTTAEYLEQELGWQARLWPWQAEAVSLSQGLGWLE